MLRPRDPATVARCGVLALALSLCAACDDGEGAVASSTLSTWVTEADAQLEDFSDAAVLFTRPVVRADPVNNRVLVMDPTTSQVSAWTVRGKLLFVVGGKGEGPAEFSFPQDVIVEADGSFGVAESSGSRFTYFEPGGTLARSELGPGMRLGYQGFRVELGWPRDGVYVGTPSVAPSIIAGTVGVRPLDRYPLLGVRRSDSGEWQDPKPLLTLDRRNLFTAVSRPGGGWSYSGQPFKDADQVRYAPGTALVMRQKGAPGTVELVEVDGDGDTLWHRHLRFEPRRLTRRMIDERLDVIVEAFAPDSPGMSSADLRRRYDEALYKPEYVAVADRLFLTASGEVWLRTSEVVDTLRVHYVVPRGESSEPPRRVLLPARLEIGDATETHVWGVRLDALDVPHIVGRRLLPASGASVES